MGEVPEFDCVMCALEHSEEEGREVEVLLAGQRAIAKPDGRLDHPNQHPIYLPFCEKHNRVEPWEEIPLTQNTNPSPSQLHGA